MANEGILGGITKALGTITPITGGIGTLLQGLGTIGSFFNPDTSKRQAASLQQTLQGVATDIEERVKRGEMDPDAALQALHALRAQALQVAGTPSGGGDDPGAYSRAAAIVNAVIGNVEANIRSARTAKLSNPITGGLTGSPEFQKSQLATGLRNALVGLNPQGLDLESSPIGRVLRPTPSPLDQLGSVSERVNQLMPERQPSDFSNQIRSRLQDVLQRNRVY